MIKHFFTIPHPLNPLNLLNLEPLGGPLYTAEPAVATTLGPLGPSNLRTLRTLGPPGTSTLTPKACPKAATTTLGPLGPSNLRTFVRFAGVKPKNPFAYNPSTQPAAEGGPNLRRQARPFLFCGASRCHNLLNPEPRSGPPYPSKE